MSSRHRESARLFRVRRRADRSGQRQYSNDRAPQTIDGLVVSSAPNQANNNEAEIFQRPVSFAEFLRAATFGSIIHAWLKPT
jgi:serine/threonine protein kinase HipA of HipAB toxin-antitoxin module